MHNDGLLGWVRRITFEFQGSIRLNSYDGHMGSRIAELDRLKLPVGINLQECDIDLLVSANQLSLGGEATIEDDRDFAGIRDDPVVGDHDPLCVNDEPGSDRAVPLVVPASLAALLEEIAE